MIDKALLNKLTEAAWERQAADIAQGRGLLKSSLEEALAGVLALQGSIIPPKKLADVTPVYVEPADDAAYDRAVAGRNAQMQSCQGGPWPSRREVLAAAGLKDGAEHRW